MQSAERLRGSLDIRHRLIAIGLLACDGSARTRSIYGESNWSSDIVLFIKTSTRSVPGHVWLGWRERLLSLDRDQAMALLDANVFRKDLKASSFDSSAFLNLMPEASPNVEALHKDVMERVPPGR